MPVYTQLYNPIRVTGMISSVSVEGDSTEDQAFQVFNVQLLADSVDSPGTVTPNFTLHHNHELILGPVVLSIFENRK